MFVLDGLVATLLPLVAIISLLLFIILPLLVFIIFIFFDIDLPSLSEFEEYVMLSRGGRVRVPFRRNPLISPREMQSLTLANEFEISPGDVVQVKDILSKARNLPPELVDMILDRAEYWACSTAVASYSNQPRHRLVIPGAHLDQNKFLLRTKPLGLTKWSPSSQVLWKAECPPKQLEKEYPESKFETLMENTVSTLEYPFRKVVFDIVSCDQGYSSHREDHGTYRNSWTWFDAGLERFDMNNKCLPKCPDRKDTVHSSDAADIPTCAIRSIWPPVEPITSRSPEMQYQHELLPTSDHLIQRNKHAERDMQHYRVEWYWNDDVDPDSPEAETLREMGRGAGTGNGEFVRNLKFGDMITIWGRARFPGWANYVQRVEVKVYWAS
ncbi:hypothetical protein F4677DRAFT_408083 [Hypoxylon crocopeplum]|nr:hypothetical protein F4677DRAFT_408083 [Hypoxylon crocopeplum]